MNAQLRVTGGGRIGWVNVNWPLVTLTAEATSLVVAGRIVGSYELRPDEVVAFEPAGFVPMLGKGVRILHTRPDYPASQVWMIGDRAEDVAGGRANGTRTAGVLWGYGSEDELVAATPDVLVRSMGELVAVLA